MKSDSIPCTATPSIRSSLHRSSLHCVCIGQVCVALVTGVPQGYTLLQKTVIVINHFHRVFFFSVYVFDPATPRPVAVQSNVSKKADVVSAAFDPGYLSCSSTKDHPIKMSKLYFLNHNQVSLLCLVYCLITSNGRVPKTPADVSKNYTTDTSDHLAAGHF